MDMQLCYSLTQIPFTKETRLKKLYESSDRTAVKSRLKYLTEAKGIGVFTGNPGTGKTAMIRDYVQALNPSLYKVIYVKLTSVSVMDFFRQLAFGLNLDPCYRKADVFRQIQEEISHLAKEKRCIPVIIIDEAQHLSQSILRDLVLLLNFDMDSRDNCILILSGLPHLNGALRKTANEALSQRIIVNYNTEGITREETDEYIRHILEECGTNVPLFSPDAVEAAYRHSGRSIRKLNRILFLSLTEGANRNLPQINSEIIAAAISEMDLS